MSAWGMLPLHTGGGEGHHGGPALRIHDANGVGDKSAPVSVTVFKDNNRVRIQILTHDLTREEVEKLEDDLADALEAEIVERSDPTHEASAQHLAEHAAAEARAREQQQAQAAKAKKPGTK